MAVNSFSGLPAIPASYGFTAGKNKIINGDFGIWQRGTSFTQTNGAFNADRFSMIFDGSGATRTVSQQTFTPGTAPIAGYEGTFFWRLNQSVAGTSGTYNVLWQKIEDVRTFAGQTVTFSFWAKADTSRTIKLDCYQNFGSGGSTVVTAISTQSFSATTSWQRFSFTATLPSISGKTIGTNSYLSFEIGFPLNTTQTIDIWGVQLEAGSTATAFQTATGTLAGELAACQRYYEVTGGGSVGRASSSSNAEFGICYKAVKRTTPSLSLTTTTPTIYDPQVGTKNGSGSTLTQVVTPTTTGNIIAVNGFTGLTSGGTMFTHQTDFVIVSAEL